ncbi:MAG: ABC transporter permease [Thermomicrobiales bacterium]|nr:ABC transporter permease [Thermomicrobiales bacterium]MCO5218800.1 ABC transporter permease [Thermomicrobiales bacterium]MCO5225493.1 ABC transporter permease [Thermomicrobiales bacterium]MCO5229081.1 ABC transporter permease [Thermomicrobiales bacterium]
MRYIIKRLVMVFPMLIGITIVSYTMLNLAPGDPMTAMMNPEDMAMLSDAQIEAERDRLGLNDPIILRYFSWLREVAQGNLGYSYKTGRPVLEMVIERIPATIAIAATAEIIAATVGITVGIYSALRQYSFFDNLFTIFSFFAVSVPNFFFALMGIFIFAVQLQWLPVFGMRTPGSGSGLTWDLISHMVLPVTALALPHIASYMRYARGAVLDAKSADHVRTARAKGLAEKKVFSGHVLRNAMIPMITIFTLSLPGLIGGSFVIESIFSWPGIGLMGFEALQNRDYPLQLGVTLILATLVLLANLLSDILYGIVDPRIRYD